MFKGPERRILKFKILHVDGGSSHPNVSPY